MKQATYPASSLHLAHLAQQVSCRPSDHCDHCLQVQAVCGWLLCCEDQTLKGRVCLGQRGSPSTLQTCLRALFSHMLVLTSRDNINQGSA